MINHIHIKDIFPYDDFDTKKYFWEDKGKIKKTLQKNNFLFGYNGSWKSTLVKIFKYLWKKSIIWQDFEGNIWKEYPSSFENLKEKVDLYDNQNNKLTKLNNKFIIFDWIFVNEHIAEEKFSGNEREQKNNRTDKINYILQTKEIKELDEKLEGLEQEKKKNKDEIKKKKELIEKLINKKNIENFEKIKKINENWELENSIEKIKKEIDNYNNLKEQLENIENTNILKNVWEYEKLIKKEDLYEDIKKLKEKYWENYIESFFNVWYEFLQKDDKHCPFCNQNIDENIRKKLDNIKDNIKSEKQNLKNKIEQEAEKLGIKLEKIKKETIKKEFENLQIKIKKTLKEKENVENLKKEKENLETFKVYIKQDNIENLQKEIDKYEKKLDNIKNDEKKEKEKKEKVLEDFSNNLEENINIILQDFWIEHFKLKTTINKKPKTWELMSNISIQNTIDDNMEIRYLSEWEKRIIWLAFFLALLEKKKNDLYDKILIFDDPVTSFDDVRRKKIVDVLNRYFWSNEKKLNVSQIFVLTHDKLFFKFLGKEKTKDTKLQAILDRSYWNLDNKKNNWWVMLYETNYEWVYEKYKKDIKENKENPDKDLSETISIAHKLRFCIEYFIKEELLKNYSFDKWVSNVIWQLDKISDNIWKYDKEKLQELDKTYQFCNSIIHHETEWFDSSKQEMKKQINVFLSFTENK